ncbi:MAG: hypothetical protein QOJ64_2039 [Acidobacteriota bacterium]|jgi:hypothetical protein|nr:hypothetical protein [Acidobacteriota bacterium]
MQQASRHHDSSYRKATTASLVQTLPETGWVLDELSISQDSTTDKATSRQVAGWQPSSQVPAISASNSLRRTSSRLTHVGAEVVGRASSSICVTRFALRGERAETACDPVGWAGSWVVSAKNIDQMVSGRRSRYSSSCRLYFGPLRNHSQ